MAASMGLSSKLALLPCTPKAHPYTTRPYSTARSCAPPSSLSAEAAAGCVRGHHQNRRFIVCSAESTASSSNSSSSAKSEEATPPGKVQDPRAKALQDLKDARLPKTGYFSIADPKQEVWSKASEKFDPRNKGGRYKSEFIWNTNWQEAMKREESLQKQFTDADENRERNAQEAAELAASRARAVVNTESSAGGTVSFSRLSELDSVDADLSGVFAQLRKRDLERAAAKKAAEEEAARKPQKPKGPVMVESGRFAPSRGGNEERRLQRASRITNQANTVVKSSRVEEVEEKAAQAVRDNARYKAMTEDFLTWTLILTAVGGVATYTAYSKNTSISYLFGALGGVTYLRLLSKSVDAVGGSSEALAASAQPRLLIPVILALGLNRWNLLFADKYDMHLQLLPVLVGFFTYKFAVLARETKKLVEDMDE